MLACFGVDDSKVLILDMRSPGVPVAELVGHQGPLSAIAWGSGGSGGSDTGGGWIASCGMSHIEHPYHPPQPRALDASHLSQLQQPSILTKQRTMVNC